MGTTRMTRPDRFDRAAHGGANYALVTMIVADRLAEAERARVGAHVGPSLRTRLGTAVVRLGTAIGGRSTVPTATDTSPGPTLATANRTGTAAGGW